MGSISKGASAQVTIAKGNLLRVTGTGQTRVESSNIPIDVIIQPGESGDIGPYLYDFKVKVSAIDGRSEFKSIRATDNGAGNSTELIRMVFSANTLTVNDDVIILSGAGYSFTLLPSISAKKRTNLVSLNGTITILPDGSDTIFGLASYAITAGETITIGAVSNDWLIMG